MCMKFKTFRVVLKIYAPYISRFLWFLLFVAIIVIFSKYTYDAASLRKWMSDENSYASPNGNKKIYQIINYLNTKAVDENVSADTNNYNNPNIDENKDEKVEESRNLSTIDPESNNNTESYDAKTEVSETLQTDSAVTPEVTSETTNTECKPEPPRSDFRECGNRIAERKCCEYMWAWQYKKELMEREQCLSERHTVIGGKKVSHGEFPHMAAIGYQSKRNKTVFDFKCGGSLISNQFVLTAGHCTMLATQPEYESQPSKVRLGVENIMCEENEYVDVRISDVLPHPDYRSPSIYYDIALLRLFKPVSFTYTIHPACLSTDLFTKINTANVTGWGTTDFRADRRSDHLLVATVKVVEHNMCSEILKYNMTYNRNFEILHQSQICAGSDVEHVDTCQGDSGGPLQVRINSSFGNIHTVYGVTSAGSMCGVIGTPAIYVKVAAVVTWIENTVWPEYKENTNYRV